MPEYSKSGNKSGIIFMETILILLQDGLLIPVILMSYSYYFCHSGLDPEYMVRQAHHDIVTLSLSKGELVEGLDSRSRGNDDTVDIHYAAFSKRAV